MNDFQGKSISTIFYFVPRNEVKITLSEFVPFHVFFCKVSSLFTFHIYSANFSVRRDFNNLIVRSKIPWKNKCVVTPQMPRRRPTFQMSNLVQQFFYCRIGYTSLKITNCFKFQRTNFVKILYDWNQIEIWTGIL